MAKFFKKSKVTTLTGSEILSDLHLDIVLTTHGYLTFEDLL